SWAHERAGWIVLAIIAASLVTGWFYLRRQRTGFAAGLTLSAFRAAALVLLILALAEPVLELSYTDRPKPLLWLLADASDSMNLVDDSETGSTGERSRADLVRAALVEPDGLAKRLANKFRVQAFTFDRPEGVRPLDLDRLATTNGGSQEGTGSQSSAERYSATGTATAIGSALDGLRRRYPAQDLSGIVVLSDFVQNAGSPATDAAEELGVPIFAVGLGRTAAADLMVELDAEPTVKKAERVTFTAVVRQNGLTGSTATLRLTAAPADRPAEVRTVGTKDVALETSSVLAEFAVTPEEAGRFVYALEADVLPGETIAENNTATRNVTVTDDYLRLLFVEYEPTWEWRFVKEVFHRDRLVGLRGFRTYLRSSDPAVRKTNELFLETLPPPRDEFFQYDVIFLGDVPASALPGRFAEMTKEFVSQFGGGLVVIGGPRFGPQALAETPLADMLPIVPDAGLQRRDASFRLNLTPAAEQFDFMRLGETGAENRAAWQNLGELPWYQPVRRVESTAVVLAEHPTDTTSDGRTKQPLIARRPYGAAGGEVVYLGFNETWRLRRKYGEKYYRQFWGQLIYRLGLGHARGADKRFVIDPLPDEPFQPDDEIAFTVRAWDRNFDRLTEADVPNGVLTAELIRRGAGDGETTPIALPMSRPGVFETRMAIYRPGDYRLRVIDPVTSEPHEARFSVADVSAERRVATRDAALQQNLANAVPGGRAYELDEARNLADDFDPPRRTRTTTELISLWDTWLVFGLFVGLLMAEWLLRKRVNLA
ncbi:MAG: hypothetical protein M3552_10530, partial [Planctomycetota bacterium]|nr:hypothetical protein [Planctomycetota bacterium]